MEKFICSSCQSEFTITDFTAGKVRQQDGKLFCIDCMVGAKHVSRIICPECQHQDSPMYDGKSYLCRKCGKDLGQLDRWSGGPAGAGAAPSSHKKCPYCAESIPVEAVVCRHCNSSLQSLRTYPAAAQGQPQTLPIVLIAIGLLVSVGLAVYAIVTSQNLIREEQARRESESARAPSVEQELQKVTAELGAKLQKTSDQISEVQSSYDRLSQTLSKPVIDEVLSAKNEFNRQLKETGASIRLVHKAVEELAKKQEGLATEISAAKAARPVPAVVPAPAKAPAKPQDPKLEHSYEIYSKVDDQAMDYLKTNQFGKAIRGYENFIRTFPESPYRAQAEERKLWYETYAHDTYDNVVKKQAAVYVQQNKHDEAIKLLEKVMDFGLPELTAEVQKEISRVASQKEERAKNSIRFDSPPPVRPGSQAAARKAAALPGTTAGTTSVIPAKAKPFLDELPTDLDKLVALLQNPTTPSYRRKMVVRALEKIHDRRAVAALVRALKKDEEWGVQGEAAKALGNSGDLTVVEPLIEMLAHPIMPVKNAAKEALQKLTRQNRGDSKEGWATWWRENRDRLGIPSAGTAVARTGPTRQPAASLGAPKGSSVVIVVQPEKNSLLFKCDSWNPLPKKGETLNVSRNKQVVGKIEVTDLGPGIARGVVIEEIPGTSIRLNDVVTR